MRFQMMESELSNVVEGAKATGREEAVIWLKEDRWLIKSMSESDILMFGAAITEDNMESYEQGDAEEIGIPLDKIGKYLSSTNDNMVTVELISTAGGSHKIQVSRGNSAIELGAIVPEYVSGKAKSAPGIDYAVQFTADISFLQKYVQETDNILGAGSFMVSPRDGLLYLYAETDVESNWERHHWEDFEDYDIDWSKGFHEASFHKNPEEDHAVDSMMSVEWFKNIELISDEATVYMDNHAPMKILFHTESGMKASYFLSPRLSESGSIPSLPDRILVDRSL